MKRVILLLIAGFSLTSTFAGPSEEFMSAQEQMKYINKAAKELRRTYWINGYEDVSTRQSHLSKTEIDELVRSDNNYHGHLDSDEVSDVYRCHYKSTCEVYLVNKTSSYHSGWGQEYYYFLLDTKNKRHDEVSHLVYGE